MYPSEKPTLNKQKHSHHNTMTRKIKDLKDSDKYTYIKVVYKEDVRMGATRGSRWMVYGLNARPWSNYSLLTHAKKKKKAVSKAKDIAKGAKPSKLKIYNKEGIDYREHEYK